MNSILDPVKTKRGDGSTHVTFKKWDGSCYEQAQDERPWTTVAEMHEGVWQLWPEQWSAVFNACSAMFS